MKKSLVLALLALLLLPSFALARPALPTTTIDQYLSEDAPVYDAPGYRDENFDNYGTNHPIYGAYASLDSELWTGSFDGYETGSYLKATGLNSITNIIGASLKLYAGQTTGISSVSAYYVPTNSWNAATLTWNNQPDFSTFTLLSTASITGNGWYSWDVSGIGEIPGDHDAVSLLLIAESGDPVSVFYGSETLTGYAPRIEFTTNTAPEPISSALLLIGGGALGFIRRFKRGA